MDNFGVMKVSVIGHSFVRRLDHYVKCLHEYQNDPAFLNLELPYDQYNVGLYGIGGLKCVKKVRGTAAQGKFKPDPRLHSFDQEIRNSDIVVVELGSNCLCDPELGVFLFVSKLLDFASFLKSELNVKLVALSQLLPRAEDAQPFPGYNNKIVIVNEYIDYQLRVGGYTDIYFWRHRAGLWNYAPGVMHADGVHFTYEQGYIKYYRSIRDAIVRMRNKLVPPVENNV